MSAIRFDSLHDYQQHIAQACATAQRQILWFDDDLSDTAADSPELATQLKRLLVGSSLARVQILLNDDAWFCRKCSRLQQLVNIYGHAFELRLSNEIDKGAGERFLLTEQNVVRIFHSQSLRGEASDHAGSRSLCLQRFEALWLRAEPPSEGRRLYV